MPHFLNQHDKPPPFSEEEIALLKEMLGHYRSHKEAQAARDQPLADADHQIVDKTS
jgi:hypothetical protein